jgi:hypothetical protein
MITVEPGLDAKTLAKLETTYNANLKSIEEQKHNLSIKIGQQEAKTASISYRKANYGVARFSLLFILLFGAGSAANPNSGINDPSLVLTGVFTTIALADVAIEAYLSSDIRRSIAEDKLNKLTAKMAELETESRFYQTQLSEIERLRHELPAELVTSLAFSDSHSLFPNSALDVGEMASVTVTVRNNGKGTGFGASLEITSDNPHIIIEKTKSLGDIRPGEEKTLDMSLKADLESQEGAVNILVETKEKRGFDAQKQQIRIPVVHLSAPKLEITSVELNDRKLGRAQGNGNGIPENDETIELIAFIKNNGVGDAIDAKLELVEINSELFVLERSMNLGTIHPNQTVKGTLLFYVPRIFSAEQLKYQLRVSEIRGVGTAEKTGTIAIGARQSTGN